LPGLYKRRAFNAFRRDLSPEVGDVGELVKTRLGKLLGEKSIVIQFEDGEEVDITPEVEALLGAFNAAVISLIGAEAVKAKSALFSVYIAARAFSSLWREALREALETAGVGNVDAMVKGADDKAGEVADALKRHARKLLKKAKLQLGGSPGMAWVAT